MAETQLPAYEQVKAWIRRHIASGRWKPGDPVPSEAALMRQFGISRMTVNRALRELAAEGLVTRVQGSGTKVAQLHRISSRLTIRDIHEEVAERGHVHSTRVLHAAREKAEAALAQSLGLHTGAAAFHTVLIHFENGVPIQYEDRYVNPAAAPRYLETDFTRVSPTLHLLQHAPLTEASYSIEACMPTPAEARILKIKRSEPCLVMTRRTVSGAHVASVARLLYPATRYSFAGQFQA
jgi:GntR family transcriptional regulator, histidine utilization repressor